MNMSGRFPFLLANWRMMGLRLRAPILDMGCKRGELHAVIGRSLPYVGIDLNISNLQIGRARNPRAHLVNCDARTLPFRPEVFGVVFAISIFEHVQREILELVAGEIPRILKPHGQLAVQIPNSRFIIELHSRIPLFHYLPRRVQDCLKPNRRFYDLRPLAVSRCLELMLGRGVFRSYKYPSTVTGVPDWVPALMPMGYLFLFTKSSE